MRRAPRAARRRRHGHPPPLTQVFTQWERLLVESGQSTNVLFPALCAGLLIGALGGLSSAFVAIQKASAGEDVGLLLPLISSTIALLCLAVLGYGLALAPKPETAKAAEAEAEAARIAQLTK